MNDEMNSDMVELDRDLNEQLYSRHVEIQSFKDLETQRGTPIPALFNLFYKFVQNPSSVSVETFKRMVDTDDTIGSGVDFLTTALAARLGQYQHKSNEITQFVNEALNKIEGGWYNTVKELLSAAWAGFAVGEKVWANTNEGFILKKIVQLPPSTLLFETDRTGEITDDGILQYQRNYNPALTQGGAAYMFGFASLSFSQIDRTFRPDPLAKLGDFPFPLRTANTYSYLSIRIPKQKCVHYSFDAQGKFGNPYGRSLLRRCYKYYVMKDAFLQMLSVALDRKGTPLTIVYADPNATLLDQTKFTEGRNYAGVRGSSIRADLAAKRAFENIHNDTTIILPGKKGQVFDTDFVQQTANQDAFIQSLDFCNKSILRALLVPSLIFGNGDGTGSYSLGQEHAKTFDKICDGILAGLKQVLLQQVVKETIGYNFPKEAWEKDGLGDFSKRQLSQEEVSKEIDVVEKAVNIGAVDMNDLADLNAVRDKMGFEPRTEIIEKEDPFGLGDEDGQDGDIHGQGGPGAKEDGGPAGPKDDGKPAAKEGSKPEPKGRKFGWFSKGKNT